MGLPDRLLKDGSDKNALEILIEQEDEMEQEYALDSIISILSYLTADEQQYIMGSLSEEAKEILDDDNTYVCKRSTNPIYF